MNKWEILSGLPVYGPSALNFSATGQGKHREGLVLKFRSNASESWVGNFQPGLVHFNCAMQHPDDEHVIVVAGGEAYVISPTAKECVQTFGGQIIWAESVPDLNIVLIASLTDVLSIGKVGIVWRSGRISWDGLRTLKVDRVWLTGEAYSPYDKPEWRPFRVDVTTGHVQGGTYP
jgi:hypothetical protein